MSTILITGGTGTLGRRVIPLLRDAGRQVRVLSRHQRPAGPAAEGVEYVAGDLATGAGVTRAVTGVETIVHAAGSAKGDEVKTRHLVAAARRAGTPHLVYISVVGADRVPVVSAVDRMTFGYFAAKGASEELVAGSGLPWTTLRATQFQESVLALMEQMTRMPVVPSFAGTRFQPVAVDEVAQRLVELALGEPAGLVPDLAGPRAYDMRDLVRSYLKAVGKRRLVLPVRVPGRAAAAVRDGANLNLGRAVGVRTWEDLLGAESGLVARAGRV